MGLFLEWNSLPDFTRNPTSHTELFQTPTSASSALAVLNDNAPHKSAHARTHSLTDRGCFPACEVECTEYAGSRRAVGATSEDPRTPHRHCRTESRVPAGKPSACPRTAWPSAGPTPRGPAPVGCPGRSPSLGTGSPAKPQQE